MTSNEPTNWVVKSFAELTTNQLYQILRLRSAVFVLEQDCAYQDIDDLDQQAWHVFLPHQDPIKAYARILPPTDDTQAYHIGRVVVADSERKQQLGQDLMRAAISHCQQQDSNAVIEISAQTYLTRFYQALGFVSTGKYYLEDDIAHQTMLLQPKNH